MIKADFHVHSDFSIDCTVKAERQIERAIELGLDYICITDHCDMNKCKEKEHLFDIKNYVGKINEIKETLLNFHTFNKIPTHEQQKGVLNHL